jgi:hypothetical protein
MRAARDEVNVASSARQLAAVEAAHAAGAHYRDFHEV